MMGPVKFGLCSLYVLCSIAAATSDTGYILDPQNSMHKMEKPAALARSWYIYGGKVATSCADSISGPLFFCYPITSTQQNDFHLDPLSLERR